MNSIKDNFIVFKVFKRHSVSMFYELETQCIALVLSCVCCYIYLIELYVCSITNIHILWNKNNKTEKVRFFEETNITSTD